MTELPDDQRQVGGDHYKKHGAMQPFNIIKEYHLDFFEGNALKYLLRFPETGNANDIRKAIHYLQCVAEMAEEEENRDREHHRGGHVTHPAPAAVDPDADHGREGVVESGRVIGEID